MYLNVYITAAGGCSSSLSLSSSSSYGSASDVSLQRRTGAVPGAASSGRSRSRGGARGAARVATRPQPLFQLNEESPSVEDKPLPRAQTKAQTQPSP